MAANNEIMPDRDDETGQYTDEYTVEDFESAINAEGGMAGTGEIAERVGCAHDTAYKRLKKLENDGIVSSEKVGNTLLWRLNDQETT